MPRANRHYIPGYVWHITHRCHKKEFLLKFSKDRRLWLRWLFEAKKRYGISILNYTVTSNHVHVLVVDDGERVSKRTITKGGANEKDFAMFAMVGNNHDLIPLPIRSTLCLRWEGPEYEVGYYRDSRGHKRLSSFKRRGVGLW